MLPLARYIPSLSFSSMVSTLDVCTPRTNPQTLPSLLKAFGCFEYFTLCSCFVLEYIDHFRNLSTCIEEHTNDGIGAIVLSQVAPMLPLFSGALAAFERLRKDIETEPTIGDNSVSFQEPAHVEGAIGLRDITFTYPSRPDHPVLNGLSLDCEPGKLTAIVGLSGSGKSTVASLITRFYDPQSGDVLLDGANIKDMNVKALRGHISLVQQEPSLLDRSILENIALGLVNSPAHQNLSEVLLSNTLAELSGAVRTGQDLR
jgi:ATP-binding cassette subfamily B (MDR/TAP) protein 1